MCGKYKAYTVSFGMLIITSPQVVIRPITTSASEKIKCNIITTYIIDVVISLL